MNDPITLLYLSLLLTSTMAARAAREVHHADLARVYAANSPLHGLLGVFHWLGI